MSTDSLNVRLAGVNCCFEKALFSGFWNTCGWKLDPFRAASACPAAFSAGRAGVSGFRGFGVSGFRGFGVSGFRDFGISGFSGFGHVCCFLAMIRLT